MAKRKSEKFCWWALPTAIFMAVVLAVCGLLALEQSTQYEKFKLMRNAVAETGFYQGTVVDGYSLGSETLENALSHWQREIEPSYSGVSVTLSYNGTEWQKTAAELGYSSDYEAVLRNAWSGGRNGTLEERYNSIKDIKKNYTEYHINRVAYSAEMVRLWTDEIAASLTKPVKDATIIAFDTNAKTFTFGDSEIGYSVDADALYRSVISCLNAGGGYLSVDVREIQPAVTKQNVQAQYGMITQAVTKASTSTADRLTNIKLALASINGYCLEPGETFSYNDVVGQRTKKRGYKIATVFAAGEISEDVGGGVCQVSTTLWNAAMKADCELVERHEHSIPVSYVDKGKDATVSWGSQDMKFKNTSDSPMYLVCYLNSSKRVVCEIYGKLLENGVTITIETKITETIDPGDAVYTYNAALDVGTENQVSSARKGYKVTTYRVYTSAAGAVIRKETLCKSYYKPSAAQIEFG